MKTLNLLFFALLLSVSFTTFSHAQSRTKQPVRTNQVAQKNNNVVASKIKLKTTTGFKMVDYVAKSKLKEGRNFVRFGNRRMYIGVQRGKVMSVKVMNRVGKWGPNVIGTAQQKQHFWCVGGICGCTGDTDCNDMFTSAVCGDAAVCVGDDCYCAKD